MDNNNIFLILIIKITKIIIIIIIFSKFFFHRKTVSVIIPTFNREKTLLKSINSVLNQTYKNLEILIIDDCSTDNTPLICKGIIDKRIKYIKLKKRYGASYARNLGIKLAKGTFITFQDSDDIFISNKIEKQLENLYKYKSDFDFCKLNFHYNKSSKITIPNNQTIKKYLMVRYLTLYQKGILLVHNQF